MGSTSQRFLRLLLTEVRFSGGEIRIRGHIPIVPNQQYVAYRRLEERQLTVPKSVPKRAQDAPGQHGIANPMPLRAGHNSDNFWRIVTRSTYRAGHNDFWEFRITKRIS